MIMNSPLPPISHRCWLRLASGNVAGFQTRQLALQLMFKRLQHDPLTPAGKATEIHAFFIKYEKILGPEIAQLASL